MKLGFIGAGNMAGAIIKGFVNKNCVNSSDIYFIRQNKEKQAQQFQDKHWAHQPSSICSQMYTVPYLRE